MGYGSRAFLAGGLGFAVSFVVACGGGNGLLSGNQAADLSNQLNTLSSAVASFQCSGAQAAARSFSNSVANLPSTVNTTLAQNLSDLMLGPGHYAGTPLPGQPGNAAIAGHRTTYLHPFYSLDQVAAGDPIYVTT